MAAWTKPSHWSILTNFRNNDALSLSESPAIRLKKFNFHLASLSSITMSVSSEANLIPDRTVSIARGGSTVSAMEQQPSEDAIGSATDAGIKNVS